MFNEHTRAATESVACLPVTALHVVSHSTCPLLLSARGSALAIYGAKHPYHKLHTVQIFDGHDVHGIASVDFHEGGAFDSVELVIWGGMHCALATLVWQPVDAQLQVRIKLHITGQNTLDDWIMCVHTRSSSRDVTFLTAHNSLYQLCLSNSRNSSFTIASVAKGLRTLLYSGHVVSHNATSLIIASGTVFGEIIVWTCSQQQGTSVFSVVTRHVYLGHQGSIFGVRISDPIDINGTAHRLLASCSDDRTIRVWDISDCDNSGHASADAKHLRHETGFGLPISDDTCLTMAWGHQSRIWSIYFLQGSSLTSTTELPMLSRGEDGVCQLWSLSSAMLLSDHKDRSNMLRQLSNDHHHAGKNIWSLAHAAISNEDIVFTGGADGRIVARNVDTSFRNQARQSFSMPFQEISMSFATNEGVKTESDVRRAKALKHFLLFETGEVLATTDHGDLLIGNTSCVNDWQSVDQPVCKGPMTLGNRCAGRLAFFGRADGSLAVYNNSTRKTRDLSAKLASRASIICVAHSTHNESNTIVYLVVNAFAGGCAKAIRLHMVGADLEETEYDIDAPPKLNITCAYLQPAIDVLLCGSRTGAFLVVEDITKKHGHASSIRYLPRIHDFESVTSISALPSSSSMDPSIQFIISTGRDGTYAIHKMSKQHSVTLDTLHRSTPPFGPMIEGSYVFDADGRQCIALFGFKSKDFIVWNETEQTTMLSADCGGAHRSWSFAPGGVGQSVGHFVWSQAGRYNAFHQRTPVHNVIEDGGHGRELKALAISPRLLDDGSVLIATGAEDTDVRLFKCRKHESHTSELTCFSILKGHTAGLQDLKFSPSGKYLITSAGCEELNVWKLATVPIIDTGSVLVTALSKQVHDSDARIMAIDVASLDGNEDTLSICAAYSNGKLKVFRFVARHAQINLQHEHDFGAICLTQAYGLDLENILIGATDGFLRVVDSGNPGAALKLRYQLHQSSILGMAAIPVDGVGTLVVTGGDDNALSVSLLRSPGDMWSCEPLMVPHAHAAALTAVAIYDSRSTNTELFARLVSVGNDGKVIFWRLHAKFPFNNYHGYTRQGGDLTGPAKLGLTKLHECWTDVADVSGVEVIISPRQSSRLPGALSNADMEVLVTGVGMQVVRARG